eukprot:m.108000 g.108000  ORF g.108000 m.108000 type:complete len:102 (-) comp27837_c0_seq1:553-858(-)
MKLSSLNPANMCLLKVPNKHFLTQVRKDKCRNGCVRGVFELKLEKSMVSIWGSAFESENRPTLTPDTTITATTTTTDTRSNIVFPGVLINHWALGCVYELL